MKEFWKKAQEALRLPFRMEDIEWRVQSSGQQKNGNVWCMAIAYITARAVEDRLDDVFGVQGWKNHFRIGPNGGQICTISAIEPGKDPSVAGNWVSKEDGSDNTDIEAVKGGLSTAMKRAAVQWGIGRYLYKLDTYFALTWAGDDIKKAPKGAFSGSLKNKTRYKWQPPGLPGWATLKKDESAYIDTTTFGDYSEEKEETPLEVEEKAKELEVDYKIKLAEALKKGKITQKAEFLQGFNIDIKDGNSLASLFTDKVITADKKKIEVIYLYARYYLVVTKVVTDFKKFMDTINPTNAIMLSHIASQERLNEVVEFYNKK